MALRGSLDDVPIVDVLQFVHLSGKSGVLVLTSPSGQGRIEFRQGNVVFAQAPGGRTIGELLSEQGTVSPDALNRALAEQEIGGGKPLGRLLLESGAITREALESCIRAQIQAAIMEFARWHTGEFQFGQDLPPPTDDIRVELGTVLPELTMNTQFLLLEAARVTDEREEARARGSTSGGEESDGDAAPISAHTGRLVSHDPHSPRVAVELEPLRATPPPPRVFASPPSPFPGDSPSSSALIPSDGSAPPLTAPLPAPRSLALALVGFERESWPGMVRGLKALRWPVLGHSPVSKAAEAVNAGGRLANACLLIWRVRGRGPIPFDNQLAALRRVQKLPRPPQRIVIAENLSATQIAALYTAGTRAVLPVDAGPLDTPPPGLSTLLTQIRREQQRDATAQAAELRAWLHAKRVTSGMQQALQRANIALEFMRVAASSLERAVLFLKKGDELIGLGAFGTTGTGKPMADALRGLALSVPPKGRMAGALRERRPLIAPPDELGLVPLFFDIAGRPSNDSATLIPVSGPSRAIALLYGDNGPLKRPIGNLHPLEIAAGHAGIAYENALLRLQLGMPVNHRDNDDHDDNEEDPGWVA